MHIRGNCSMAWQRDDPEPVRVQLRRRARDRGRRADRSPGDAVSRLDRQQHPRLVRTRPRNRCRDRSALRVSSGMTMGASEYLATGDVRGEPLRDADLGAFRAALLAAGLPADDIAAPGVQPFRFSRGGKPVGYGAWRSSAPTSSCGRSSSTPMRAAKEWAAGSGCRLVAGRGLPPGGRARVPCSRPTRAAISRSSASKSSTAALAPRRTLPGRRLRGFSANVAGVAGVPRTRPLSCRCSRGAPDRSRQRFRGLVSTNRGCC